MKTIFYNGKIFTGESFLDNSSVMVTDKKIASVGSRKNSSADESIDLKTDYLVPAFIDLQLYGGLGKLFGEHPSVDALTATYKYSLTGGATNILPTVATNSPEVMLAAIEAVKTYRQEQLPGLLGLHLEGPFINPEKRGAHIEKFIKRGSIKEAEKLCKPGKGIIKMMTLAPEVCDEEVISYLNGMGIILSAGHSNATYEEAVKGFNKNIHLATHLFNAMSPLQHRGPGMVGAIFNSEKVMVSIVADGYHVDYAAVKIAKKIMGQRLFLITDAVTENREGYYQHRLEGEKYVVADGTLSGSSLTMLKAMKNCVQNVGIPLDEALRMASLYPARAINANDQLGMIRSSYEAELLWLNEAFEIKGIYTNGSLIRM